MTLKEQILSELQTQDEIAQAKIKELDENIRAETFAMSTVTGGAFAGTARNACQSRIQAATSKKNMIVQQNSWIREMLSKYR